MKQAIYQGIKDIEMRDSQIPGCEPKGVVLKNRYAAICGSDISAYYNGGDANRIFKGFEFGHEMVSEVVAVGEEVNDIKVGDIVYPYPLLARGDSSRAATVGGFSEYIPVPNAVLGQSLYAVSDKIPLKVAALIEPFTVGMRAARRSRPKAGEKAIVFGAGAIGLSAAMSLKYWGLDVMVVDLSDFRLEKAIALGFHVCNSAKENLKEKAMEIFGTGRSIMGPTADADIYIDAVGHESVFRTVEGMIKLFARFVVVGVHHKPIEFNLIPITYGQWELLGSGGYMPEDVKETMEVMESGIFDIESIVTHEFHLSKLEDAIVTAGKTDQALKVVIKYE